MKKTVTFNYKRATKRLLSFVAKSLEENKTLQKISDGLRDIVNSYIGLNRNERYDLYINAYKVARSARAAKDWHKTLGMSKNFDKVVRATRRVKGSSELRHKKREVRAKLRDDTVFFLCSTHSNPAEDHKDYQGKIYVDRFWRLKTSGEDYYKVMSYIKNHDIVTVQEIMGSPVYLCTRPYCKHFFIPLQTSEVLGSSLRKINETYGEYTRESEYTYEEYKELRSHVYAVLDSISESKYFK